jgi:hypothetical protein
MLYDETGVALVALEAGASWPSWLGKPHPRTPNTVVEAQLVEESAGEYATRVLHRVARGGAGTGPLKLGLIATNGDSSEAATAARSKIARGLCAAMNQNGGGELLLVADGTMTEDARHSLLALAGTLIDQLGFGGVGVRVRFPDTERESGVMPRVARVEPPEESARISTLPA